MSIQSEINRIKANIADAYSAVEDMGGDVPAVQNSGNLAEAVRSIQAGVDTSDATATAADIVLGKTAYVDGEKIFGSLDLKSYSITLVNNSTSGISVKYVAAPNVTTIKSVTLRAGRPSPPISANIVYVGYTPSISRAIVSGCNSLGGQTWVPYEDGARITISSDGAEE